MAKYNQLSMAINNTFGYTPKLPDPPGIKRGDKLIYVGKDNRCHDVIYQGMIDDKTAEVTSCNPDFPTDMSVLASKLWKIEI